MEAANAGELLRGARLRHGISREALAIRAGFTRLDIADIEECRVSPSIDDLNELLHLVGSDLVVSAERRDTGIDRTLNHGNLELSVDQRIQKGLQFADLVRVNRPDDASDLGRSLALGSLLSPLQEGGVDFVVIGSIGGLAYGSAYPTFDLDIASSDEPENRRLLAFALTKLGCCFSMSNSAANRAQSFDTEFGRLDVIGQAPGIRSYEELRRDSHQELLGGIPVQIASLDHLIAMKRASKQRKDQLMLMEYVEIADELGRVSPSLRAPAPGWRPWR
jgi:transcriptional regulator with XRE-family HTH domain